MAKLSLAKLERHLYSAADRLRQEGLDAATYKDYIFGMLFLKRCSDVFDGERQKIIGRKVEQGMIQEEIDSARRLVSLLFERNSDYFVGKVVQARTFTPGSVEARFYALLVREGPVGYDDRKSAIEVQVNRAISLKEQLLFVVLPRESLEEAAVRDAIINVWNCDPVLYATFMGDAPASYYSVVRQKVMDRFVEATRI